MNRTTIEWVRNPDGTQGYTFNPITGCLNGCPYCYARRLANGRLKERYCFNLILAPSANGEYKDTSGAPGTFKRWLSGDYADPFFPRFWPERLKDSGLYTDKPRGIFVCDMGELFGDWIPTDWQAQIFFEMRMSPQHRFYLLTNQPQNLERFSPFPLNCYVGVTATNQKQFDEAVKYLGEIEASIKFISFEPLLERINLDL